MDPRAFLLLGKPLEDSSWPVVFSIHFLFNLGFLRSGILFQVLTLISYVDYENDYHYWVLFEE